MTFITILFMSWLIINFLHFINEWGSIAKIIGKNFEEKMKEWIKYQGLKIEGHYGKQEELKTILFFPSIFLIIFVSFILIYLFKI